MSTTQDTPRSDRDLLITDLRLLADELELTSEKLLPTPILSEDPAIVIGRHMLDVREFTGVALAAELTRIRQHPDGDVYLHAIRVVGAHVHVQAQTTMRIVERAHEQGVDLAPLATVFPPVADLLAPRLQQAA